MANNNTLNVDMTFQVYHFLLSWHVGTIRVFREVGISLKTLTMVK